MDRFKVAKKQSLRHYRALANVFRKRLSGLADELNEIVAVLEKE